MITRELAVELARRGLPWRPASGDRFHVPDRDLDDEVFVVSGMSVEVSELPFGSEVRFNGTVEWALDSVTVEQALWLPHEHQLRAALGSAFRRLELVPPDRARVTVEIDDAALDFEDDEASAAYGRALLHVLTR